jgi:Golgi phosphoprotein 3 (GPP34)
MSISTGTAQLTGTDRLADDLYMLAHDDRSGRPYLRARAAGLGLAAALLAELVLEGRLLVGPGVVLACGPDPADKPGGNDQDAAPADPSGGPGDLENESAGDSSGQQTEDLAERVWHRIATERDLHSPQEWLAFLARTAVSDVASRLAEAGYLILAAPRWPHRRSRWVPADPDCAFMPVTRARAALHPFRPPTIHGAALAGLAAACGLGDRMTAHAEPGAARSPDHAITMLPPELQELIACTRAAVDSAMLASRL